MGLQLLFTGKLKRTIYLFFICVITSNGQALESPSLSLLEGRWYIQFSNFPMWLKGNKTHPTFNYTAINKNGKVILKDEVKYVKGGKEKMISGYDYPTDEVSSFLWRGKGLLRIAKSKWEIIYYDKVFQFAIIRFKKTAFTPAGIDVISREKNISVEVKKQISNKLKELGIVEELTIISQ